MANSKVTALGFSLLVGTACTSQWARTPLDAMLLSPVDGKVALWINQPAYFAVLGVGPERGAGVSRGVAVGRTMRYLAAKDGWHALTHHGEPGTEVARAMESSSGRSPASSPAVSRVASSAPSPSASTRPH